MPEAYGLLAGPDRSQAGQRPEPAGLTAGQAGVQAGRTGNGDVGGRWNGTRRREGKGKREVVHKEEELTPVACVCSTVAEADGEDGIDPGERRSWSR